MIKYYSQNDPSWYRKTLGNTHYTIGDWGCLLTCFSNAILILYKDHVTPDVLADIWKFTKLGELIHKSIKYKDMVSKRMYSCLSKNSILNHQKKGKLVMARLSYNPRHWVLITKWGWKYWPYFLAIDPYSYNPKLKCARIKLFRKALVDGMFVVGKEH